MSHYDRQQSSGDMSAGKSADETQPRREAPPPPPAPRQQLPSLSSLFGPPPPPPPPPPPARPLHSPLSDRPTPSSYAAATSPLDRPPLAAAAVVQPPLERAVSSSFYPPTTAPSSVPQPPRSSFDPRLEDRLGFGTLPRTSFPGPLSPHSRELDSRADYGAGATSKWSALPDAGRSGEYGRATRDHGPFRSPNDRYPPPLAGQKHEYDPSMYRDQRPLPHAASSNLPPTPSSTVASDGVPVKDGLGPKIWTGTHFLPRFVRAAEVPGEGTCYFYDDGSHCKSLIDGEAVNAHWGVTKAGKPRKRLAIACVTCREKKIKCDPDYPRCVQCEKFGRVCRFKNA